MQQSFRTGVQRPSPTPYQDVTFDKKVERRKSLFTGIFSFLCPFSGFVDAFGAVPTRSLTPLPLHEILRFAPDAPVPVMVGDLHPYHISER